MKKSRFLFILSVTTALALASCTLSLFGGEPAAEAALATPTLAATTIELGAQADAQTLTAAGQVIKYAYTVKNTGAAAVAGPVSVSGGTCPEVTTIGNADASFDAGESIACSSQYTVTQADLDKGSVELIVTASVSGINSNSVTVKVSKPISSPLTLNKTASPTTYEQTGQIIAYSYVITNTGATALGPSQFIITDSGIPNPVNCGDAAAVIAPAATLTCAAAYSITQADVDAGSITSSATATGGGVAASPAVSLTLTKGAAAVTPSANAANLTAGATIQHKVTQGEWLWQIARCYGADPEKTLQANPQLTDPGFISPSASVTVPNIGSAGKIYGLPCVGTHTVVSGDTWNSVALLYNADPFILQMVNKNVMTIGQKLTVPLNSAGTTK